MPPTDRFVISFAAEPPQEALPYGRWADTLRDHFLAACHEIDADGEDLGDAGEIAWFPDRSYCGRTYVPAVARTTTGYELFGFVSFREGGQQGGRGPVDFEARADYTSETAETNPDWKLDINDEVVGRWRGEQGNTADMTLVWGVPMRLKKAAKIAIARRKLATGPASTTRNRCQTGRSWKACARISGRISSISEGLLAGVMSPTNFT